MLHCLWSRDLYNSYSGSRTPTPTSLPSLPQTAFFFGKERLNFLSHHLPQCPEGLALTCALWVIACPGAIDRAVSAEQACGVVAFPTLVDNGVGENQAIAEHNLGIAWSPRVPTRDH
jgi:hypothetical protein